MPEPKQGASDTNEAEPMTNVAACWPGWSLPYSNAFPITVFFFKSVAVFVVWTNGKDTSQLSFYRKAPSSIESSHQRCDNWEQKFSSKKQRTLIQACWSSHFVAAAVAWRRKCLRLVYLRFRWALKNPLWSQFLEPSTTASLTIWWFWDVIPLLLWLYSGLVQNKSHYFRQRW